MKITLKTEVSNSELELSIEDRGHLTLCIGLLNNPQSYTDVIINIAELKRSIAVLENEIKQSE